MAFPLNPNIGDFYITPNGNIYEFQTPGVWKNVSVDDKNDGEGTVYNGTTNAVDQGGTVTADVTITGDDTQNYVLQGVASYKVQNVAATAGINYDLVLNNFKVGENNDITNSNAAGNNYVFGEGHVNDSVKHTFMAGDRNTIANSANWATAFGELNRIWRGANSCILSGWNNYLGGKDALTTSGGANSVILGGQDNELYGNNNIMYGRNIILGDPNGTPQDTQYSFVVGFNVTGSPDPVITSNHSIFLSRTSGTPGFTTGIQELGGVIIGGYDNQIQATHEESVILGMKGQQSVAANTTHVDNLWAKNELTAKKGLFGDDPTALRAFNIHGYGIEGRLSIQSTQDPGQSPQILAPALEMTTDGNTSRTLIRHTIIGTTGTSLEFFTQEDGGSLKVNQTIDDDGTLYFHENGSSLKDAGFRNNGGEMEVLDKNGSWESITNSYQFQAFSVDSSSTTAAHITFRGKILIDEFSLVKDGNVSSVEWYYRDSTTSGAFVKAGAAGTLAQLNSYIDGSIGPTDNISIRPLAIFSGTGLASVGFDYKILYR